MERKDYLKMRNDKSFDLTKLYHYYVKKREGNGDVMDFNVFSQTFKSFLEVHHGAVLDKLDREFDIVTLEDKNKNPIKFL